MYEHKILETAAPKASEEQLDKYSEEGWDLFHIQVWEGKFYYYFRKMKVSS